MCLDFFFLPVKNLNKFLWPVRRVTHCRLTTGQWKTRSLWKSSDYMPPYKRLSSCISVEHDQNIKVTRHNRVFDRVVLSLCANHSAFLNANTFKYWREIVTDITRGCFQTAPAGSRYLTWWWINRSRVNFNHARSSDCGGFFKWCKDYIANPFCNLCMYLG